MSVTHLESFKRAALKSANVTKNLKELKTSTMSTKVLINQLAQVGLRGVGPNDLVIRLSCVCHISVLKRDSELGTMMDEASQVDQCINLPVH